MRFPHPGAGSSCQHARRFTYLAVEEWNLFRFVHLLKWAWPMPIMPNSCSSMSIYNRRKKARNLKHRQNSLYCNEPHTKFIAWIPQMHERTNIILTTISMKKHLQYRPVIDIKTIELRLSAYILSRGCHTRTSSPIQFEKWVFLLSRSAWCEPPGLKLDANYLLVV